MRGAGHDFSLGIFNVVDFWVMLECLVVGELEWTWVYRKGYIKSHYVPFMHLGKVISFELGN